MTLTREDDALAEWESSRPDTFYDPALDHLGIEGLREFGETVARVVDPAVAKLEARRDRPMTDGHRVVFDPAYETAGRAVWASGVVSAAAHEQAALMYLLAHAGEGGHACPLVCTAGLVRALRGHASDELRERFLPPLLVPDYDRAQRGAQFLTELQGGSDVGANRPRRSRTTRAETPGGSRARSGSARSPTPTSSSSRPGPPARPAGTAGSRASLFRASRTEARTASASAG